MRRSCDAHATLMRRSCPMRHAGWLPVAAPLHVLHSELGAAPEVSQGALAAIPDVDWLAAIPDVDLLATPRSLVSFSCSW